MVPELVLVYFLVIGSNVLSFLSYFRGKWNPNEWILGQDIAGSTVGIIGLGGIGQAIAKRLKGFEINEILYTGHKEKPEGKSCTFNI